MFDDDPPPLSWEILQTVMAGATGWAKSWRVAGSWALSVLQSRLGDEWPADVARNNPTGGAPELALSCGHVAAYAHTLELALRLELLGDAAGMAKIRRTLRTDLRPAQRVHCEMQLEVAGLALRLGLTPELEPAPLSGRPADVSFVVDGEPMVVEARAILASESWRGDNTWNDELFERIREIEMRHGVRCEGEISTFLDERATVRLLNALDTRARLVAVHMEPPRLREPGVAIDIVRQARRPARGLRGPQLQGNSLARIAPRIAEKAEAAGSSGANWLRLDARDGLWQFTEWATRSLGEKAQALEEAVGHLVGPLDGIVASCGPLLRQGSFSDESSEPASGLFAVRRCLPFTRVRETIVMPRRTEPQPDARFWRDLYADEQSWLDWALAEVDLPSTAAILSR